MSTTTTRETAHKTILLSKKGMKELKKSIAQLQQDRQEVCRLLRESDKGTGHDDRFERNERLLRLEAIESELAEKQHIARTAQILSSKRTRMKVAIGSVVDLIDQSGRMFSYTLVDSIEANPSDGRISAASPLGSTLLGKTVKDIVEWGNEVNRTSLRLVRIS